MALPHAQPGEVVEVRPTGEALSTARTTTLFKTPGVEMIRLVMTAGKTIAPHSAPGELIVQCLHGKIAFTALGKSETLAAGQLLYLPRGERHAVECLDDAACLLTIVFGPPGETT